MVRGRKVNSKTIKFLRLLSEEWIGIIDIANQLPYPREGIYSLMYFRLKQGYAIDRMKVGCSGGKEIYYRVTKETKQRIDREYGSISWEHKKAPIPGGI